MTLIKVTGILGMIFLAATPIWASSIYGGFEDTTVAGNGDFDYNDVVFSITGATLVQSGGQFFSDSASQLLSSADSGTPFWNRASLDADSAHDNVGYCIYGDGSDSGACNGHPAGLDTTAQYLATSTGGSVTDVTFTPQDAAGTVLLTITADNDVLYWYDTKTPTVLNLIGPGTTAINLAPGDSFGLAANNGGGSGGTTFYSVVDAAGNNGGDSASLSHFAFFENPTTASPEPATMSLFGAGLIGIGIWSRKKRFATIAQLRAPRRVRA